MVMFWKTSGGVASAARSLTGPLVCAGLATLMLAGCGGDEDPFAPLEPAAPLSLDASQLGVGVHHGDALAMAIQRPISVELVEQSISHGMLRVKSYDELSTVVGEYHAHSIPAEYEPRTSADFPTNGTPAGRLAPRTNDLYEEVAAARERADVDVFSELSVVVDFWRERGDWVVRWDGLLNQDTNIEGKGTYGFTREDMVTDLLDDLVEVAQTHKPRWIIVGDAMDRFLAGPEGEPLSEEEFEAFEDFFVQAVDAIKEVSPDTGVAAGFHWENITGPIAARYTDGDVNDQAIDKAFAEVVLPFVKAGDALALRSYANPNDMVASHYQYLRRVESLHGVSKPVIVYSAGSPITTQTAYTQQANYFNRLLEYLGGVNVELLAWERLTNVDGVDTTDQSVVGRCRALSNPEGRVVQMELSRCFDGLFALFMPKAVMDLVAAQSAE
ncbi:hypothetical protein DL240_04855 [Lujinxingia litoralis]|uniref:GH10 domain-containing protein n=1 Tax=Lujinxingia litoralis TaxID=2211119 RepID=A0A328C922_9DELT|nr:hypothetical protein [Lujinxingia litoralis]RAL23494.1 hypothetical protein DL240_04855 [Lujinxingia litoralis]